MNVRKKIESEVSSIVKNITGKNKYQKSIKKFAKSIEKKVKKSKSGKIKNKAPKVWKK